MFFRCPNYGTSLGFLLTMVDDYGWQIADHEDNKMNFHDYCFCKDKVPEVVIRKVLKIKAEKKIADKCPG